MDYTATLPAKRIGAGALFFDDADRVLLVKPVYKDDWEIPGGVVEANESPWTACCREIKEELGLSRTPRRLLAIDWLPPLADRTEGLMVVFDGGRLTRAEIAKITVPSDELRGYEFCALAEAARRLSPRMTRRLTACLAARETGAVAYLENGIRVEETEAGGVAD